MCDYNFATDSELTARSCLSAEELELTCCHQQDSVVTQRENVSLPCVETLGSIVRGRKQSWRVKFCSGQKYLQEDCITNAHK